MRYPVCQTDTPVQIVRGVEDKHLCVVALLIARSAAVFRKVMSEGERDLGMIFHCMWQIATFYILYKGASLAPQRSFPLKKLPLHL